MSDGLNDAFHGKCRCRPNYMCKRCQLGLHQDGHCQYCGGKRFRNVVWRTDTPGQYICERYCEGHEQ